MRQRSRCIGGAHRLAAVSVASLSRNASSDIFICSPVHPAVDDHSRLAYAEVLPDERGTTCAGFLTRAATFYAAHGVTITQRAQSEAMPAPGMPATSRRHRTA
jgi:hypothetical protein